jgi:uncharacterized protein (DUF934 family)
MQLVKSGHVVEDRFVRVLDGSPLPDGPVLIPAERFLADSAELSSRDGRIGVIWPNHRKVSELAPYLHRVALVVLAFPNFKDGRAYSQARQLREQHGYRGELRASGEILRDQLLFLIRAGFDAFEVKKDADVPVFAESAVRYSVFYQPAGDERMSALRRRLSGARMIERQAIEHRAIGTHAAAR